ncbi:MAG: hypothetical protein ACI97A_003255 [Planctomycetota bacterium]|jgi:hypothetical protein
MLLIRVLAICFLLLAETPASAQEVLEGHQQGQPLEWIVVPNHPDQFYMGQRTLSGALKLTPNECFFPKLGLAAQGEASWPGSFLHLNQNKNFQSIGKWDQGDEAEWGLLFEKTGEVNLAIHMAAVNKNRRYSVFLGGRSFSFTAPQAQGKKLPVVKWTTTIDKPGRYSLVVRCEEDEAKSKTRLDFIEASGAAVKRACVLRKRWRPKAAHTRFSSSHDPKGVRLWIVEMDAAPGKLNFYAPMTTPFGYYGPTWLADGRVNVSINFSLWSFKRGAPEPPIEELSHLLAIGNPDASFGGFDHEGTGVKVRNWKPFEERQGQKQVLALRVEPGEIYDTYFSYFLDSEKREWCFFASGRKLKPKRQRNFYPGSFVEVPGRAHVQRTGAYKRRMRYRGWVVDDQGALFPLDRMTYGDIDKKTKLTYTDRGLTRDGRFFLETGGWIFRKKKETKHVKLPAKKAKIDFLDSADLKFLAAVPSTITGTKANRRQKSIAVEFDIQNRGKNAEAQVYWGYEEGLTFAKRWTNSMKIAKPLQGKNRIVLKGAVPGKQIYLRFFLKNSGGQFWSNETMAVN